MEIKILGLEQLIEKIDRLEKEVYLLKGRNINKKYYSKKEAAEYLNVSQQTIDRFIQRKLLKKSLASYRVQIPFESLENFKKISLN